MTFPSLPPPPESGSVELPVSVLGTCFPDPGSRERRRYRATSEVTAFSRLQTCVHKRPAAGPGTGGDVGLGFW